MQHTTETLERSTTQDMWTSLVEDFRVKILALRGGVQVLEDLDQDYGPKCLELFGRLDQNTQSLKIRQLSLFEDSKEYYLTFPKSGMMLNGSVFQTSLLDTPTKEKGFTLLPTPTKSDYKATFASMEALNRYLESGHQISLMHILCQKGFTKYQRVQIFEMVMGFNPGHTELERLETQSTLPLQDIYSNV